MPNLEVHFRNRAAKTYGSSKMAEVFRAGYRMSDLLGDFTWLGKVLQKAVYSAYNEVNERQLKGPDSVLVRFIEASKWDVGIDDIVFVIKCGQNGMSEETQQKFCDIFDETTLFDENAQGRPLYSLTNWLRHKGVSYSVELFNYCSHGFGKTPDLPEGAKAYTF